MRDMVYRTDEYSGPQQQNNNQDHPAGQSLWIMASQVGGLDVLEYPRQERSGPAILRLPGRRREEGIRGSSREVKAARIEVSQSQSKSCRDQKCCPKEAGSKIERPIKGEAGRDV